MKIWSAFLLGALFSTTLPGQGAGWQNVERGKLLEGVSSLPKIGAPGPVAIWGSFAFPVIGAADGGNSELALVAAAGYGKGKALIMGHGGYLSGDGETGAFLLNAIRWASAKERPKVGLKNANLGAFLDANRIKFEVITKPLEKKVLNDFDVVIANVHNITDDAEGLAVREYIKEGGGFIAAMTGWAYEQTSGGKTLSSSHGLNKGLLPLGIGFTDSGGFGGSTLTRFEARPELPRFMNAFEAITAMKRQQDGGPALNPDEINQGANAIQVAMAAQPPGRTSLQDAVLGALGPGKAVVPTPEKPLNQSKDAPERIRLGMETRVLRLASGETVSAHPAAEIFPGTAPKDAPKVKRVIDVDTSIPGWASTGLWVNAGEPFQVTIPEAYADKGYNVRIGCHTDTLYHLENWSRAPDISRSVPISTAVLRTASAFGGLVYIEVPGRNEADKTIPVSIEGGIEAPYFVLGKHTDAEWNEKIKKLPGPWAEFACENIVLTLPSETARKVRNPTELMEFWKEVGIAQDDITNQLAERRRPERIVADIQISAGYMHSGYPIMIPTSAGAEMVTFGRLEFPGWGFYHELGHNHQRRQFTFSGAGEVTNNVIGLYCYHAVLSKEGFTGHPGVSEEQQEANVKKISSTPKAEKWELWKSEPFLALTMYMQLIREFGWESWRAYMYSFADSSFGPGPNNDDETRDQFLVRYSKITKKNLGPFFDAWGVPVSAAAKSEVEGMETWMPKGLR